LFSNGVGCNGWGIGNQFLVKNAFFLKNNIEPVPIGELFMKKRILLVDDDEGLRDLYKEELEDEGYELLTAKNGKEALQRLEKDKPDLIVLDIVMPKMDGMEALGRIIGKDKTMPIILHTSHPGYQENFMSWAADAYLLKSTNLTELKEKIRELLEKRKPSSKISRRGGAGEGTIERKSFGEK
jgi:DNA-binding response OmpR family regulator